MDLPTYTNIWRIEKRLYKLYDFRLPAPLPITWIAVFAGITVPYVVFLVAIGLPFNHNLVWLYILPPGLLTWLTTRPVIENKRLPELVSSQLRYLAEPKTWCRMAPFSEKDHVAVSARVWRQSASSAQPEQAERSWASSRRGETTRPTPARPAVRAPAQVAARVPAAQAAAARPVRRPPVPVRRVAEPAQVQTPPVAQVSPPPAPERATTHAPVPQRATASPGARGTASGRSWAGRTEPDLPAGEPHPQAAGRPAWPDSPADRRQDSRTLEVSHDPEPEPGGRGEPRPVPHGPPSWPPPTGTFPIPGAVPELTLFPEAGPFPETGAFPEAGELSGVSAFPEASAFPVFEPPPEEGPVTWSSPLPGAVPLAEAVPQLEAGPLAEAESPVGETAQPLAPLPDAGPPAEDVPPPAAEPAVPPETAPEPAAVAAAFPAPAHVTPVHLESPAPATPGRSIGARVAALFVDFEGDRPLPSVERALSGPGSGDASWHRRVKVVTGSGQGPGQRALQVLDRDRARLPLSGPRVIAVLGCTSGAGQSTTVAMAGLILATLRGAPVAALDLNPGEFSLAARITPATSVTALLAGEAPDPRLRTDSETGPPRGDRRPRSGRRASAARLDVIADPPGAFGVHLDGDDYQRLAGALAARYPLIMLDQGPSGLTRALSVVDQLVLVAPDSPEAATALAHTQQWLNAHGYDEMAERAVTVINGVRRRPSENVLLAESVARGRCRAIVRVPWDEQLPVHPDGLAALIPQTRLAYTALAGVLVSGLGAANREAAVRGRSPGEHSD